MSNFQGVLSHCVLFVGRAVAQDESDAVHHHVTIRFVLQKTGNVILNDPKLQQQVEAVFAQRTVG